MYYLVVDSIETRTALIQYLRENGASPAFHYQPLHQSEHFKRNNISAELPEARRYGDCLVRLPLFNDLDTKEADRIAHLCLDFFVGR